MEKVLALSVLDGRYSRHTKSLAEFFSEFGYIKHRVEVEVKWFLFLMDDLKFGELSDENRAFLNETIEKFTIEDANKVKEIERITNHDVKAVEYFLKDKFKQNGLESLGEWIHFGCTSEDINNTSYALMIKRGREKFLNLYGEILSSLEDLGVRYKDKSMMSRTHGQPATPTTMGKELINFAWRLRDEINTLKSIPIQAKMNGATGNYNAHIAAFPEIDWIDASKSFIEKYLGVTPILFTTQINPYSYISKNFHSIVRICGILTDLARDMWGYISLGYFKQKVKEGEVGSSTMPHKVNPIDFENAEGNFGIAASLAEHMAFKLLNSRFQRDLSDSTVLRNTGSVFGYMFIAGNSLLKGLSKVELNEKPINDDLSSNLELLAEPVQTVMRAYGEKDPYEKMKILTRGHKIETEDLNSFIDTLELVPEDRKNDLKKLTPHLYTGAASALVDKYIEIYLKN